MINTIPNMMSINGPSEPPVDPNHRSMTPKINTSTFDIMSSGPPTPFIFITKCSMWDLNPRHGLSSY